MSKKLFYFFILLIFVILLSGCAGGGPATPVSDEANIKSVIYEHRLAINNQNWNKAKSYCVDGSDAYYKVVMLEDMFNNLLQTCNNLNISASMIIYNVSIYGNYSEAYGNCNIIISGCGMVESTGGIAYTYLQRVGNTWKIYGP